MATRNYGYLQKHLKLLWQQARCFYDRSYAKDGWLYHNKGNDMSKLERISSNIANNCLHTATTAKFYPFTESDKELLKKSREDLVGGSSQFYTKKTVVDESFFWDSTNWCKSFVKIHVSQLYPFSMFQAMPNGLYTRWLIDSEAGNFEPCQNKTRTFENMVMSYFQRVKPQCKVESSFTTSSQKKYDIYSVDGFCGHCNTVFQSMDCYFHYCQCQETRLSCTE